VRVLLNLATLLEQRLSSTSKGVPDALDGVAIGDVPARRLNILRDSFPAPVAVIRDSALRTNIELMRRFTESAGVKLAPHGKTTMCPQLFDMQLEAGAWGMTCATAAHLRVYRQFGVPRIIMANQLMDADSVRLVARHLASDPGFEFYGIVDSVEAALRYEEVRSELPAGPPLNLLLEIGAVGGRTGVRTEEGALRIAREIASMGRCVRLVGVEAFEGIFPGAQSDAEAAVDALLRKVGVIAERIDRENLFQHASIILSAGGSAHFDQVVKALKSVRLSRPTTVVLRSGCYITHDHGIYATALERLRQRSSDTVFAEQGFEPALELWTTVQSLPEPGLAIVTLGRRDVSFDAGLPVPIKHYRSGGRAPADISGRAEILRLNDHHGYLRFSDIDFAIQDRIAVGISHPCTTFDRWEYLYLVRDNYDVVSVLRTYF